MTKKEKCINILFILLSCLLMVLPNVITAFYDVSYRSSSQFIVKDGIMDFNHSNDSVLDKGISVSGNTEFYYNKWLITDEETDSKADGYLSLPNFWTKLEIDNDPISKDGYATYRFKVINLPIGIRLSADYDYFYSSCRIFFDDVLVGQIGEPGKTREEDIGDIHYVQKGSYLVTKGEMTVTIEAGNTGHGGIKKGPKLISNKYATTSKKGKQFSQFILLGIMFECFVLLIITRFFQAGFKKTLHIFGTASFLFLYWIFSGDGLFFFSVLNIPISYMVYKSISVIALGLFILAGSLYVLYNKKLIRHKYETPILLSLSVLFILCRSLFIYGSAFIFLFMLFVFAYSIYFFHIFYKSYHSLIENMYVLMFAILIGVIFLAASDDANLFSLPLSNILSISIFIGSILFYIVFFTRVLSFRRKANKEKELLQDEDYLKALALRNQINPDFIFNALSIIEDTYHKDVYRGDSSLSSFSESLRYSILTIDKAVVTFSEEVDNLMRFMDFNNLRESISLPIILNIDTYEFMIPPITLVPFVNCFLLHTFSETNEEKNVIELSTVENKNEIVVKLIDHRSSYEINQMEKGIQDLIQRISLTVKGKVSFSTDDGNTTIQIVIPKNKREAAK